MRKSRSLDKLFTVKVRESPKKYKEEEKKLGKFFTENEINIFSTLLFSPSKTNNDVTLL
jgi:hypothetical protein